MATRRPQRPRDPQGRRQAIIDAAGKLLAERGIAGLTHRRIAEIADVPVGSTTYYFSDLDELVTSALADTARRSADDLRRWANELTDATDKPAALARLAGIYLHGRDDTFRTVNELYAAAAHRPELRPLARMWTDGLLDLLGPLYGPIRARDIAIYIDGTLINTLITNDPPPQSTLESAIRRLAES